MSGDLNETGEVWAYRASDRYGETQRAVLIEQRTAGKSAIHWVIRLDSGAEKAVAPARLKCPWDAVEDYERKRMNLQRIESQEIDETESWALWAVLETRLPDDLAWLSSRGDIMTIVQPTALAEFLQTPLDDLLEGIETYPADAGLRISAVGALRVAAAFCAAYPDAILDEILAEEAEAKQKAHDGGELTRQQHYESYLRWSRPQHELMRQWCGYAAVSRHERLLAAEAEVHRLGQLLRRAIAALKPDDGLFAESLRREFIEDEIAAWNVRPLPERPLRPSEIPARIEYRRAWWGRG